MAYTTPKMKGRKKRNLSEVKKAIQSKGLTKKKAKEIAADVHDAGHAAKIVDRADGKHVYVDGPLPRKGPGSNPVEAPKGNRNPVKRGRGRPRKSEAEKKAAKRKYNREYNKKRRESKKLPPIPPPPSHFAQ